MGASQQAEKAARRVERIERLRDEAGFGKDVSVNRIGELVDHVGGDFGLALDAMTMIPRPAWVSEKLGLHPDRAV